ncbi:MAG: HEAT repeat domain-containing protein, partial [Gaiellaceae bacterium]
IAARARGGVEAAAGRDAFRDELLALYRQGAAGQTRRLAVVRSLALLGDPQSRAALVPLLLEDRSPRVREVAATELARPGALPESALDRLVAALDGPSIEAKRAAQLERVLAAGGVPVVRKLLPRLSDAPWARAVVARVGLRALPFLRTQLRRGGARAKVEASFGLLELRKQHPAQLRPVTAEIVTTMLPSLGGAPLSDEVRVLALVGRPAADAIVAIKRRPYTQLHGVERRVWENADATLAEMWARSPASVAHLVAALQRRDYQLIALLDVFFVQLGEPGSEKVLVDALAANGNSSMALDFLLSGNEKLGSAARSWAAAHGYVVTGTGTAGTWGAARTTPR